MDRDDLKDDAFVPIESLRRRRADRRAAKRRMYRRAVRILRSMLIRDKDVERLAHRHADNMAICSCWMCRGDKYSERPASEARRIARAEPEEQEDSRRSD